jgi:hypothetical protein
MEPGQVALWNDSLPAERKTDTSFPFNTRLATGVFRPPVIREEQGKLFS